MNSRIRVYMSVTLLLSPAVYAMDSATVNPFLPSPSLFEDKKPEDTVDSIAQDLKKQRLQEEKDSIQLMVQSIPMPSVEMSPIKTEVVPTPSEPSLEIKNISKSSVVQWIRDSSIPLVGRGLPGNIINELENGKFDKNNTTDTHRLDNTLESAIKVKSIDNLNQVNKIESLCEKQGVSINNEALAKKLYAFKKEYRKQEEGKIKDDTLASQKQTLETCVQCVKDMQKMLEGKITEISAQNKKHKENTDKIFVVHQPTVQLAYEAERRITRLHPHVQFPDDYKISPDACDRKFLESYLELTQPIHDYNAKIELMQSNLTKILALFEFVDKKAIEQVSKVTSHSTQLEQQPQQ